MQAITPPPYEVAVQAHYGWEWVIWLAMFVAIEGQALLKKNYSGTLTAHVRRWASFEGKGSWWRARRAVLLGFLTWLAAHLVFPRGSF